MKATVMRVRARSPFDLVEIDVSMDRELERRYGQEIPVLEIDGRKVAKYRIEEQALERALAARAPDS
jgi:hypothetical protein